MTQAAKKGRTIWGGILVLVFLWAGLAQGREAAVIPMGWQGLETRHTLLVYNAVDSLYRYYDAINYGPQKWNQGASLLSREIMFEHLVQKTDTVFERVQQILDMKTPMPKVRVMLFVDHRSLARAYAKISSDTRKLRAWYLFSNNTVYVNVSDLHEGILAHELAHGIIDHYFAVKPPSNTAEILARYVDAHLK